jgi:hypothetical protein
MSVIGGPLRLGEHRDRLDRGAVGSRRECGRAGSGADVDDVGVEVLVGLVAAGAEDPFDRDALGRECILEALLVADNEAERVVVGVVDGQSGAGVALL